MRIDLILILTNLNPSAFVVNRTYQKGRENIEEQKNDNLKGKVENKANKHLYLKYRRNWPYKVCPINWVKIMI